MSKRYSIVERDKLRLRILAHRQNLQLTGLDIAVFDVMLSRTNDVTGVLRFTGSRLLASMTESKPEKVRRSMKKWERLEVFKSLGEPKPGHSRDWKLNIDAFTAPLDHVADVASSTCAVRIAT